MDPGNGIGRDCFRGGGPVVEGSGYATDPKGAATEPRCDWGCDPIEPRNGVLLDA
jgi:hypothetical protein